MTTKRIVVGAHYGLKDWLAQRITAVVLAVYTLVLGLAVLAGPPLGQASWKALFSGPFIRVLTVLAFVALAWHAWIGMRDIWMDYVKPVGIRLALHVFSILWLVGCAGWAVQVLWRL